MASDDECPAWLKLSPAERARQWDDYDAGRRREMPDHVADLHREIMQSYEEDYNTSKNPLWAWCAIDFCLKGLKRNTSRDFPLPDWCKRYLAEVAHQIVAALNKASPPPVITVARSGPPQEWEDEQRATRRANEWNDLALRALGLRHEGRNAFTDYVANRHRDHLRARFAHLLASGLSRRAAREILLIQTGRDDDRELRRLLRDVQAPPPEEDEPPEDDEEESGL
jgi:hypothetical protein